MAQAGTLIDFEAFHQRRLPELLAAGHGALAAPAVRQLPAIAFRLAGSDEAWSYRARGDSVEVLPGSEAAAVEVVLDHADWSGLVQDLETAPGLLYGDRIAGHRGDLMQFVMWEPALRAMFHGRPLYDPGSLDLRDSEQQPLALDQAFTLADSPPAMGEYLQACGYLLVKNVFDAAEIEAFRQGAQRLRQAASEGDQTSWWGRNEAGQAVLCRVIHAGVEPTFRALYDDQRVRQLRRAMPAELEACDPAEKDGLTVIYKNPGVVSGLSDLPWHRDCGMGGHGVMCPTVIMSIYLYDATEAAGALRFMPGSHLAGVGFADAADASVEGAVTVAARAGDVTLHLSDVMHAAPPPTEATGPFRQSVLLSWHPAFRHHRGERHYNDVLLGDEAGQVRHLKQVVADGDAG